LEKLVKDVVAELGLNATVEKVEDIQKIMRYGIMSTPGLVINEKVIFSGRLPKSSELKEILTQNS
ncbi:MAG: thioredoxin family protein, partial [Bacteroidetes bacterium]|nr:thioredoxin family protein [Bacteroidota bacterium]